MPAHSPRRAGASLLAWAAPNHPPLDLDDIDAKISRQHAGRRYRQAGCLDCCRHGVPYSGEDLEGALRADGRRSARSPSAHRRRCARRSRPCLAAPSPARRRRGTPVRRQHRPRVTDRLRLEIVDRRRQLARPAAAAGYEGLLQRREQVPRLGVGVRGDDVEARAYVRRPSQAEGRKRAR